MRLSTLILDCFSHAGCRRTMPQTIVCRPQSTSTDNGIKDDLKNSFDVMATHSIKGMNTLEGARTGIQQIVDQAR
jgi:hypothetical protein